MQDSPGTFIVIEGADGSGKKTQFNLLRERLRAVGYDVAVFDYPQYDKESSYFVKQYLAGAYGPAHAISPYTASMFYALDRYESAPRIRSALNSGKVVLSNRFVGANMAHQGSKIPDPLEQRSFFVWEDSLEFQLLQIPRPKLNIFLRVPAEISAKLIAERSARTGVKMDEHEKDIEHLRKSVATYDLLCQLFPNDFKAVECTENGQLLSIPEINNRIWEIVKPMLPQQPSKRAKAVTLRLDEIDSKTSETDEAKDSKEKLNYHASGLSLAALLEIGKILPSALTAKLDWQKSGYRYFLPEGLPKKTLEKYRTIVDEMVELQKSMHAMLKKHHGDLKLVEPTIPLLALFDVRLELSADVTRRLLDLMAKANNQELRELGDDLAAAAHKKWPKDFTAELPSSNSSPEPLGDIISRLAKDSLSQNLPAESESIKLLEAWPRNEFKALADSLYALSDLPREKIEAEIDSWPYQQKYEALGGAVKSPNSPLKHIRYHFDVIVDRLSLSQLQGNSAPEELHLQPPTPRYGYEVPQSLAEYEIEDDYISCFDKSLELFSTLQATDRDDLAAYAVLLGNKTRAQLICSAEWLESRPWASIDGRQKHLLLQLIEKLTEVHPAIGSAILESIQKQLKPVESEKKPTKKPPRSRNRPRRKNLRT